MQRPEIEAEPLLEYEIVIVGQPALVPVRPSRESLEALTWISREEGSATRIASDAAMARLGILPRRRLELHDATYTDDGRALASSLHPWQGETLILIVIGAEALMWRSRERHRRRLVLPTLTDTHGRTARAGGEGAAAPGFTSAWIGSENCA